MPATYEPIATTTLSSGATTITFSSISGSYTDIRLVIAVAGFSNTTGGVALRFNSDTGSNYSQTRLIGNGTAASSSRRTSVSDIEFFNNNIFTPYPVLLIADLMSYSGSTNKSVLLEASTDQNGSGSVFRHVGLWRNTAAITAIEARNTSGYNFNSGTTATLYGILKA
jgi:virulence-associated protein VapD